MARYLEISNTFKDHLVHLPEERAYVLGDTPVTQHANGVLSFMDLDTDEITQKVSAFYNEIKFPNYDEIEDFASIFDKGRQSDFTRQLDDLIGWSARVLELGCGTGQLSLFLGRGNREIHGVDISVGSLALAEEFRSRNEIKNVYLLHMDVFDLKYRDNTFDYVISNGVLHHTKDAQKAFQALVSKTKPGGHIVIGLYHRHGRLVTKLKQILAKLIGRRIRFLDSHARKLKAEGKSNAWVLDQFFNPHETSHTPAEVLSWFDGCGVDFVNLLPHMQDPEKSLFDKRDRGALSWLDDLLMMFDNAQIREGGFFIIVGKKK